MSGAGSQSLAREVFLHGDRDTGAESTLRGERNAALDGIRGIAVSLVLLYHFSLYQQTFTRPDPAWLRPEAWLFDVGSRTGWVGVQMFFVLSGFLISGLLEDGKARPHYFGKFYLRRALRILPLYYAVLLLYLFVLPMLPMPGWANLRFVSEHQGWYWTFLTNFLFAGPLGWPRLSSHFWTLAVEEQFYLVWPLVVFMVARGRLPKVCLLLLVAGALLRVALVIHGVPLRVPYLITPTELDGLLVGAYLAATIRQPRSQSFPIRHGRVLMFLSIVILLVIGLNDRRLAFGDPAVPLVGFTALAILFGGIVYVAVTETPSSRTSRALGNPIARFLGRYSYAIYLLHMPIIQLWTAPQRAETTLVVDGIPPFLAHLTYIIVVTGGIVLVSLFSWHLIEQPFLRLRAVFEPDNQAGGRITEGVHLPR